MPIVVGQVGHIVIGFTDTLMVGRHDMHELAAAAFVNSMVTLAVVCALGFSYGLTPVVGQMYGRGERERLGEVMRSGVWANTMFGVIAAVALALVWVVLPWLGQPDELVPLMRPYLAVNAVSLLFVGTGNAFKQFSDAIGDTVTPMFVLVGGDLLNIALNALLIFGLWGAPELGLLGAGIATLASRVANCGVLALLFFFAPRYRSYARAFLKGKTLGADFRRVNMLSWSVCGQMGIETSAFSLLSVFVGWLGTTALAAHQILLTVSQFFYMVYYGIGAAVAVRVAHFVGRGEPRQASTCARAGFHISLFIALCVSIPIFLLRGDIATWFTDGEAVRVAVAAAIIPMIAYQFGDSMQIIYGNALRGVAAMREMMFTSFVAFLLLSAPLSYVLAFVADMGLIGVWSSYPVSLLVAGLMYYSFFKRWLRRKADF